LQGANAARQTKAKPTTGVHAMQESQAGLYLGRGQAEARASIAAH